MAGVEKSPSGSKDAPVTPHDWRAGIKRLPLHLGAMGLPSMIAAILIPPGPWKWLPAAAMVGQAIRGEIADVQEGSDTVTKAIMDGVSQSVLAIVGALI